jgi:hypothetical protein
VYTPAGTPTTIASAAAAKDSSSVAGRRSRISDETLRPSRSEVAPRGVADELRELHEERLIEAEAFAQCLPLGRRSVLADHEGDRIARVLEQHERHERDHQHHQDGLHGTAQHEGKHGEDVGTARGARTGRDDADGAISG